MKYYFLLLLFGIISLMAFYQPENVSGILKKKAVSLDVDSKNTVIDAEDISLNTIVSKSVKGEASPEFIYKRIDELIGKTLKQWTEEQNIKFPPACVLFRAFKLEKEFEIWGGNDDNSLKLIKTIRVCSFDNEPGPKLIRGDGKTPEGFYYCDISQGSTCWWMWMKLTSEDVDSRGNVNSGSSFKMCINYPNASDAARTQRFCGKTNAGSEICIHGNCVSAGCISFKNRAFLPSYYFAVKHNSAKFGKLQIHIFPFRFLEKNKDKYSKSYSKIDSKNLLGFWNNIEDGYNEFNKNHQPLKFSTVKEKYQFK